MKKIALWLLLIGQLACAEPAADPSTTDQAQHNPEHTHSAAFQHLLDSAGVKGAILVYDHHQNTFFSNDFQWATKGQLPASTFKIPNSLIALETGIVQNDSTLFEWDGEPRRNKNWEQDLVFREAFQLSCVPCYQEIARKIGPKRMKDYLNRFDYGQMQVDSSNIDLFWLEGNSRITPFQQIDFLRRFYEASLPVSERTNRLMKQIMIIDESENYRLSGKTGWSIRRDIDNGWFVGFIEKKDKVYYFATNVEPQASFDMKNFPSIRTKLTLEALNKLGVINPI